MKERGGKQQNTFARTYVRGVVVEVGGVARVARPPPHTFPTKRTATDDWTTSFLLAPNQLLPFHPPTQ
jgi:hypothetical protein